MAICLPKVNREKILNAFKSGKLTIEKLYNLSESERRTLLSEYTGKEVASLVNAKFEQAMLSNQKKAFANWIERTTTRSDPIRRDMLKKVENNKKFLLADEAKGFMEDLAEHKLGLRVSEAEAKTLLDMKSKIDELKVEVPEDAPLRSSERLAYGYALEDFKTFIGDRKLGAISLKVKERFLPKNWGKDLVDIAGTTKSMVATLDNSFIGRQGWKTLLRGDYKIWGTTLIESFKNIGKELVAKSDGWFKNRNDAVMKSIRADIWSRPNALNGKYKAAKNGYELGVLHEEVFPVSFPEKIPLLGRVFKAAETAFSGSALRMRADLADAIIAAAERNGIDMLDPRQATAHGKLVGSLTGRGDIGRLGAVGREVNVLMFSVKFLKSNWDTLTAHLFDKEMTKAAKVESVKSTLRIAASITAILAVADTLGYDVEWDPRSSRSGQICRENHCFDITGGMRGLVTLGSRLVPTPHNGEWNLWSKSSVTGKWSKTLGAGFGEWTALDTFEGFFEGKLSPTAGAVRDFWKGENFEGQKPTFVNTTIGLITPISAEQFIEELQKGNDDILLAMMAEVMGISSYETTMRGYGKRWEALRDKVDTRTYNEALKKVTKQFNERADKLEKSSRWKKMDNDERSKELNKIRREETNRALSRHGIK